jgi:hypothetical protein
MYSNAVLWLVTIGESLLTLIDSRASALSDDQQSTMMATSVTRQAQRALFARVH